MRSALRSLLVLRPGWVVCGEAENAKEAISKAIELRPDLIVLDYKLQTSDGIRSSDEFFVLPSRLFTPSLFCG
jgi:chemotaxis response regulator CheB